jgi:hypothetical protein
MLTIELLEKTCETYHLVWIFNKFVLNGSTFKDRLEFLLKVKTKPNIKTLTNKSLLSS